MNTNIANRLNTGTRGLVISAAAILAALGTTACNGGVQNIGADGVSIGETTTVVEAAPTTTASPATTVVATTAPPAVATTVPTATPVETSESDTEESEWELLIDNERFGFSVGIPEGFEALPAPTNGDGGEFHNSSLGMTIRVFGTHQTAFVGYGVGDFPLFTHDGIEPVFVDYGTRYAIDEQILDNGQLRRHEYIDVGTHAVVVEVDGPDLYAIDPVFNEVMDSLMITSPLEFDDPWVEAPIADGPTMFAAGASMDIVVPESYEMTHSNQDLTAFASTVDDASFVVLYDAEVDEFLPTPHGEIEMVQGNGDPSGRFAAYWADSGMSQGRAYTSILIMSPDDMVFIIGDAANESAIAELESHLLSTARIFDPASY